MFLAIAIWSPRCPSRLDIFISVEFHIIEGRDWHGGNLKQGYALKLTLHLFQINTLSRCASGLCHSLIYSAGDRTWFETAAKKPLLPSYLSMIAEKTASYYFSAAVAERTAMYNL